MIASTDAGCLEVFGSGRVPAAVGVNSELGVLHDAVVDWDIEELVDCCLSSAEGDIPLGRRCRKFALGTEVETTERRRAITSGTARPIVRQAYAVFSLDIAISKRRSIFAYNAPEASQCRNQQSSSRLRNLEVRSL